LAKRWDAIENFSSSRDRIASLARFFYGLSKADDPHVDNFRQALKDKDPAFLLHGSDHELRVLSGAALINSIESNLENGAVLAALALLCPSVQNLRPAPPVPSIPELAAVRLAEQATNRYNAAEALTGEDALRPFEALGPQQAALTAELRRMKRGLELATEEINMLWWLFAEHSRDGRKRWTELKASAALMGAKELADLTRLIPGPLAAKAFLDRVIRSADPNGALGDSLLVSDALDSVGLEWRQNFAANSSSEVEELAPLSMGVRISAKFPDKTAWLPVFTSGTGLSAESTLEPSSLSYQFFLEIMLTRAWNVKKG
jgi:hypothetical protein